MNLHLNSTLFRDIVLITAQEIGLRDIFVEKDYWVSYVLKNLSNSLYSDYCVFKGGTSLSKVYNLINRFSEDIDLAIISDSERSSNQLKKIIRETEKDVMGVLKEIPAPELSKGSRYRKSQLQYSSILTDSPNGKIILEISAFANPYPFDEYSLDSIVAQYLKSKGLLSYVKEYDLAPFKVKVLSKEQTLIEKIVSLLRASLADNYLLSLSSKIRHFYDLYYLTNDADCLPFISNNSFRIQIVELFEHDKLMFEDPVGWHFKSIEDSVLLQNFHTVWEKLSSRYTNELNALSYSSIPTPKEIEDALVPLFSKIE